MEIPAEAPTLASTYDSRHEQRFPKLDERQLALLAQYGVQRSYPAGTTLFSTGDRHIPMFVVLKGGVDIVGHTPCGEEQLIVTLGPGNFSGEVGQLAGRAAIASARARENSDVLAIEERELRALIVANAELSELMMRAFILRRMALIDSRRGDVTVIGSHRTSDNTLRLRQFLTRNAHPHEYLDVEGDAFAAAFVERFGIGAAELPVVALADGDILHNPSNLELADRLGLGPDRIDGRHFDVAVIGAGPAGLAAAVYAASEGLRVVVFDAKAPGGQAGTSSRIENYFGFPTGITGQALAGRGFVQAQKFGAEVAIPRKVLTLECAKESGISIGLDGGETVTARSLIIASGARYRKLTLHNLEQYEGRGIYYAASFMESQLCSGQEVIVVGGGNSAGQAAVFLSDHASHVHVLVRASGLAASMSNYLVQRIHATRNITLHTETELVELIGNDELERVRWRHRDATEEHPIAHVFLFCGADPNTTWAQKTGCIALDPTGFVKTGGDLTAAELAAAEWPLARPPYRLETNRPGIFAVGDVRFGSVKRVAAAVGEGSMAIQLVHAFLEESQRAETAPPVRATG